MLVEVRVDLLIVQHVLDLRVASTKDVPLLCHGETENRNLLIELGACTGLLGSGTLSQKSLSRRTIRPDYTLLMCHSYSNREQFT